MIVYLCRGVCGFCWWWRDRWPLSFWLTLLPPRWADSQLSRLLVWVSAVKILIAASWINVNLAFWPQCLIRKVFCLSVTYFIGTTCIACFVSDHFRHFSWEKVVEYVINRSLSLPRFSLFKQNITRDCEDHILFLNHKINQGKYQLTLWTFVFYFPVIWNTSAVQSTTHMNWPCDANMSHNFHFRSF